MDMHPDVINEFYLNIGRSTQTSDQLPEKPKNLSGKYLQFET